MNKESELNKISVVIPMYNSEKTIIRTLDSVVSQTYEGNIEIIVVNDGSKDNSSEIVKNYCIVHPNHNIQLINQKNGGVSKARNTGLKKATGDLIALLDSDDEWLPNKLERQVLVLKDNPKIDFLGTNRNGEHIDKILWKKIGYLTKISPKVLLVKFVFVVPTIIFKKSIIENIGLFDESQRYAEEGNYFIRIAQKFNCYLLNESLVITGGGKAHFGHSGLSGNLKEMEKGELKNIREAKNLGIINFFEYIAIVFFSLLKYIRRIIIVKMRNND